MENILFFKKKIPQLHLMSSKKCFGEHKRSHRFSLFRHKNDKLLYVTLKNTWNPSRQAQNQHGSLCNKGLDYLIITQHNSVQLRNTLVMQKNTHFIFLQK